MLLIVDADEYAVPKKVMEGDEGLKMIENDQTHQSGFRTFTFPGVFSSCFPIIQFL